MKDSKFNMSQDFFFYGGDVEDGPVTKENFYGTEERSVSQGDILDTSLNLYIYCVPVTVICPVYG